MQTMFLAIAMSVLPMDHDADAAAALALAQAQLQKVAELIKPPKKELSDYLPNPPFVLFVGIEKRAVSGAKSFRNDIEYQLAPGIYFFAADGITYKATETNIEAVVRDRSVQPAASPFDPFSNGNKRKSAQPEARVDEGSLPSWFPKEAVIYQPARFTQRVFNRNQTQAISRAALEEKWQVPGGLAGIHGWRSTLYKMPGYAPTQGRYDVSLHIGNFWMNPGGGFVLDSNGNKKPSYQTEMAYIREYPDGAWFADVLRNDAGEVFEVRTAEKFKGEWHRDSFKLKATRPVGYVRPSMEQCAECHKQAGSGGYAVGWVPGGDEIISEAFKGLELSQ